MSTPTPRTSHAPSISAPSARDLLGSALYEEAVGYAVARTGCAPGRAESQVRECLRYLYLVSRHRDRLAGLFLPVEQDVDEIWHFLILQTHEYQRLCEQRLPGRQFIHHRSIAYGVYQERHALDRGRERSAEEALRWIPLYTAAFGPFDADAMPHWTVVRFLHEQLGMSLAEISALPSRTPGLRQPEPAA